MSILHPIFRYKSTQNSYIMIKILRLCLLAVLALIISVNTSVAQTDLSYYLPEGVRYNPEIPTPKSYLGYEVGEWHVEHDKLVGYMKLLSEASDRVTFEIIGRTYENRPLVHITITSPSNHSRLEDIRRNHIAKTYPDQTGSSNMTNAPSVVWSGYSVHGNEPSGANSALLVAYHYAAAMGPEMDDLLSNVVILLDPALNPDGLNRFAHWVNTNRSKNINADPATREHSETWPGGRSNHYWFDLNRDWLPVQHPESQARLRQFHKWKPNVVLDFHEMGTNATFFFQPGIPSRNNPLTPKRNFELTAEIAKYNAASLNEIGSLYYTRQSFDDFYYGKGSTYPDGNGSIGILFEQASSRGHIQESVNGLVSFPFTIKNQFVASVASIKASKEMRETLLGYQKEFYDTAMREAAASPIKAYVFGDQFDAGRTSHMAEMFTRHDIKMFKLASDLRSGGKEFKAGSAYIIPTNQPQYRLITAMFERRTSFVDSLFYDISAWTIPLGYGMPFSELGSSEYRSNLQGDQVTTVTWNTGQVVGRSDYAYLFEWDEYYAPRLLNSLMQRGLMARVATSELKISTSQGMKDFTYGTVMIPITNQPNTSAEIYSMLEEYAARDGVTVYGVSTGLVESGIDLGSSSFSVVTNPKTLMLVGAGVNSGSAGEIWHLLDQRFDMSLALVETSAIARVDLNKYTVLVMAAGNYGSLGANGVERIQNWVRGGGTLIAIESAMAWAASNNLLNVKNKSREGRNEDPTSMPEYSNMTAARAGGSIPGTIFEAQIDLTHPLGYGYNYRNFSIFKANNIILENTTNPYASPVRYTNRPLQAGYASVQNQQLLAGSPAVVVSSAGSGRVIGIVDDPNFRAFWQGTNKMFFNAMFFGGTISGGATADEEEALDAGDDMDN
jgi:hypothetical protein